MFDGPGVDLLGKLLGAVPGHVRDRAHRPTVFLRFVPRIGHFWRIIKTSRYKSSLELTLGGPVGRAPWRGPRPCTRSCTPPPGSCSNCDQIVFFERIVFHYNAPEVSALQTQLERERKGGFDPTLRETRVHTACRKLFELRPNRPFERGVLYQTSPESGALQTEQVGIKKEDLVPL